MPMMMSIKVPFIIPTFFIYYFLEYKTLILLQNMQSRSVFLCARKKNRFSNRFLVKTILNIIFFLCAADATRQHIREEQNILLFLLLSLETIHVILFDIFLLHIFSFFYTLETIFERQMVKCLKQKLPQFIFHLSMTFISIILKCIGICWYKATNNFS